MAKDAATQSVALLGLLNGSIVIDGIADEPYAVSQGATVRMRPVEHDDPDAHAIIALGTFHRALDALSEAFGDIPFSDTETYPAILKATAGNGSVGWLVCTPVGGNWPDAMSPVNPAETVKTPANRCFPLYHYAVSDAVDLPEDRDMDAYCRKNREDLVFVPAGEGTAFFAGWCSAIDAIVRIPVHAQDFSKPWTVVRNADGSDYIAPANPMVLVDQALNAWLPPEEAKKLETDI